MTDHPNDEALDDAIDAILTGGPASGADDDTLAVARLATHLRGMPSPEFKSRLAAELFPQRRSFLGRTPLLNRIASRRLAAPIALASALAIAAVALAAVLLSPFGGSTGGTAEAFGELPVPAETVTTPIANGTGAITWQLDERAVLPGSAPAYRLAMPEVTQSRFEQIAQALGVTGTTEVDNSGAGPGGIGYHIGSDLRCKPVSPGETCGPSLDMWTNGWFSYRNDTAYIATPAPGDATALAAAREWIDRTGLTNGDAYELAIQPPPTFPEKPDGVPADPAATAFPAQVIAQPVGQSEPNNGPAIFLSIDGSGTVINAGGFWARPDAESDYRVHDEEQVKADLAALRGTFASLDVEAGDVSAADVTRDAVAHVASVQLTYRPVSPTGDESPGLIYMVPVYTMKVDLQQDGKSVAGFATWIPATGPAR